MNEVFFVFTDEAGSYHQCPSEKFRERHPFYIRSAVYMTADDYRLFQSELEDLNRKYKIPVGEEIKWDDLWPVQQGEPRADFLKNMTIDTLKGYFRRVFKRAIDKESLKFLFTISCIYSHRCNLSEEEFLKFHLQEIMQRADMDARPKGFATVVMDELNQEKSKKLKAACHAITVHGDFIKYQNIYSGILVENSTQSAGIQLADFSVGIMNGYLKGALLPKGKYEFATDLFDAFISPNLRRHPSKGIMGYGIREVPSNPEVRAQLTPLFEK